MKLFAAFALAAGMAAAAFAQDTKTQDDPYKWVDAAVKAAQTRLGFTDEQVTKIIEKVKATLAEIDKAKEKAQGELKDLLGEESYNKSKNDLTRLLSGQQGRGGAAAGGGFGNPGTRLFDQMQTTLNLTAEQVTKIKPMQEEYTKKMTTLFEEARANGGQGFRDLGQKMRTEMEGFVSQIKETLTDEQKTKLDELVKTIGNRFGGGQRQPRQNQQNPNRQRQPRQNQQ